jgi:hypothetical protein
MDAERPLVRSLITNSGIIIALATVIVYFCVLARQTGYCTYFNVPYEFISLGQTIVLAISWPLIVMIFIALSGIACLLAIVGGIIDFLRYQFGHFFESLFGQDLTRETRPKSVMFKQLLNGWLVVVGFFIIAMSLVVFARFSGRYDAEHQEKFYVVKKFPDLPQVLVVIQIHTDYLVTIPLDSSTQEVEKTIYLVKISEMGKTPLTLEKVGPLKVKQETANEKKSSNLSFLIYIGNYLSFSQPPARRWGDMAGRLPISLSAGLRGVIHPSTIVAAAPSDQDAVTQSPVSAHSLLSPFYTLFRRVL